MDGMNLQAVISNLTQIDRFAQDSTRTPVVNTAQNTQNARDQELQHTQMAVQPDQNNGNSHIDPNDKRHEKHHAKKRTALRNRSNSSAVARSRSRDGGFFVDIDA